MKALFYLLLFLQFHCFVGDNDFDLRNVVMPFAAAAYSSDPKPCLTKIANVLKGDHQDITLYRQYTAKCNSLNDTCSAYIAINHISDTIIIAFKGTTKFEQFFKTEFNYNEMAPLFEMGKVSKQFFDAFNQLWINAGMRDDILNMGSVYQDAYGFEFIGHSTGGAMASLAAALIVSTKILSQVSVAVTTFGQPRTGDKDFAHAFRDSLFFSPSRVVHNGDIVSQLPSLNQSTYYHHNWEIWYHNDMGANETYIQCSYENGEDETCSDSLNKTELNFADHKYYYGREFTDYGIQGCPDLVNVKYINQKNIDRKTAAKNFK